MAATGAKAYKLVMNKKERDALTGAMTVLQDVLGRVSDHGIVGKAHAMMRRDEALDEPSRSTLIERDGRCLRWFVVGAKNHAMPAHELADLPTWAMILVVAGASAQHRFKVYTSEADVLQAGAKAFDDAHERAVAKL